MLFDEFGDLTEKLNELLEEDKKQTSDPKVSNGNGNGNGHVAVEKGKVSIIRDVLELRSVWSEIFLKQAV